MVFQAGKPIRVFGSGEGQVSAQFNGETVKAEANGEWVLTFSPLEYGGPYEMKINLNGEEVIISDIMIGEVVLFSGQSNMQHILELTDIPAYEYVNDDLLRFYEVKTPDPSRSEVDYWRKSQCDKVGKLSALGYIVAKRLRDEYGCAVGAVVCAHGTSIIQSWINSKYYVNSPLELPVEKLHRNYKLPSGWFWNEPGYLYRTMLSTVLPFSFGKAVWYQGESNGSEDEVKIYSRLLKMFCEGLRSDDKDANLLITIVQIADFVIYGEQHLWKGIQQAQVEGVKIIPNTKLVISSDICENNEIHPTKKLKLGERIFEALI